MAPVEFVIQSDLLVIGVSAALLFVIVRGALRRSAGKTELTPLKGPPSANWFFGCSRIIVEAADAVPIYDGWRAQFGDVFQIPTIFGGKRIVLCDPKAITHFYANETTTYVQSKLGKVFIEKFFGNGILNAEGNDHRRQRKALTPAFSIAAIRRLTSVFYDSAYKAKAHWDNILNESEKGDSAVIDVQGWMNRIALDSIGIAGFSHDFRSLDGQPNEIANFLDSLGSRNPGFFTMLLFLMSTVFPSVLNLPTKRNRALISLRRSMSHIATELLERSRREEKGVTNSTKAAEKSMIGLLIKAEGDDSELRMTQSEVMTQMNVLLLAGYETTSISLTWALIELCRKPEIQEKLRKELAQFPGNDPTLDQLTSGLPYLDAVVHETLRTHPPVVESNRVAKVDDIIPLSAPITTQNGQTVDSVIIPKGTRVTAPISMVNRIEVFWGADSMEFKPERWLESNENGGSLRKNEIQGHKHILSFSDGPRICLGKAFALAEFKSVLSVLIRNFEFSFVDGVQPKIVKHTGILPRPKTEGAESACMPLLVRRVEQ